MSETMLEYKNCQFFIHDFVDVPDHDTLLSGIDCCGDPTFTTTEVFFINKDPDSKIRSIIVQNNDTEKDLSFSIDDHVIHVAAACGFEIFRNGDHFVLECNCFPL